MDLSERLARVSNSTDPRVARDLEVIRIQMARIEGRLLKIARRRSQWTRDGVLSLILDETDPD